MPGVRQDVLVAGREPAAELAALGVEVDHDLREEVGLAEDLVHQQPQVGGLVVVDADEHRSVRRQHLADRLEARAHHRRPCGVPPGVGVGVRAVAEAVGVREVVAGVVGRIGVDDVDRPGREPRQHVEVVADVEGVPHGVRRGGHARQPRRSAGRRSGDGPPRRRGRKTLIPIFPPVPQRPLLWSACLPPRAAHSPPYAALRPLADGPDGRHRRRPRRRPRAQRRCRSLGRRRRRSGGQGAEPRTDGRRRQRLPRPQPDLRRQARHRGRPAGQPPRSHGHGAQRRQLRDRARRHAARVGPGRRPPADRAGAG